MAYYNRNNRRYNNRPYGASRKPVKRMPTHYVYVNLPEGVKCDLEKLQDELRNEAEKLDLEEIDVSGIHLTLSVFDLSDEANYNWRTNLHSLTSTILSEVMYNEPKFDFNLGGLGHFKSRVIYTDVEINCNLIRLRSKVNAAFENHGFPATDNRPYNPHITLFKGSYAVRPDDKLLDDFLSNIVVPCFSSVTVDELHIGTISRE